MLAYKPVSNTHIPTFFKQTGRGGDNNFHTSMKLEVRSNPLTDFIKSFANDIYAYCDILKFKPNWQQKELLDAYQAGESRIACRAGKGPGKTASTVVILTHWSLVHPKSKLIVTAPTFRQCKDVWLSEAEALVTGNEVDPRLKEYFTFRGNGYGILGSKNAAWGCQLITALKKEAFQGAHKQYMAFIEEEASGVPAEISNAIAETISNQKGTFLHIRIGNPNHRMTTFFDSFNRQKHLWKCLHWNTEKTPETPYFSKRRNDEIAEEFGKKSNVYRIAVLGEFPNLDPDCMISDEDLEACCTPEALQKAMFENPDRTKAIGLDLARYGGDECVAVSRKGGVMFDLWADTVDPNVAVDRAVLMQRNYNWTDKECTFVVDTSGMGESVVGSLGGANRMGKTVHEFYSQNTAFESDKYHDKVSEAWHCFAKLVRKQWVYLGEKLDRKLKQQLTTRRYTVTKKGLIKIESKDEYKKNNAGTETGSLGKSPDRADGVVMAFYPHATASARIASGG